MYGCAGKRTFLKKALAAHAKSTPKAASGAGGDEPTGGICLSGAFRPVPRACVTTLQGLDSSLQAALEKVLCKPRELVTFDFDKKMGDLGLAKFFPVKCWPPLPAVRIS